MKRLITFLLCLSILFPLICVSASAKEDYTFYKIQIDAGNGQIGEKAIFKDGEIYIAATSFSNYTRFYYDENNHIFLLKGQSFENTLQKSFKYVGINASEKFMVISGQCTAINGQNFFDLSDCFEIDGELYLPFCQMLPVLNADIYEIKDNVIYISNNRLSLAEVLFDFSISDYWFNLSSEFYDADWMVLLSIVPSYVWDTVVNKRLDRLDIAYNSGSYNDYKDIFSCLLSEDNLYLKAMAHDPPAIDSTIEFFNSVNSSAKDMKSAYGWIEAAGKSEISSETGGFLLDSLKEYYDSGELEIDDLKGINDAWTSGTISIGDCIEVLSYAYTYATQVEDNRQMLDAVYDLNSNISANETARKAAKQVYDLYGENVVPALCKEISETLLKDSLKDFSPFGIYTAAAKVSGIVLETYLPFNPGEVANLPLYSEIVMSASHYPSDTLTDESTENLRLSLLLCMIASKRCFEIMDDIFEDTDCYESKIANAEKLIMGLYIAGENTDFDSFEHFEDYKNANLKKVEDSGMFNNLADMEFPQTPEYYVDESNKLLSDGKLKSAIMTLYECKEELCDSEEIQNAIEAYFDRITLILSADADMCDEEYCFKDTIYPDYDDCTEEYVGLLLVDKTSGAKETIARITIQFQDGFYPPADGSLNIVGNNEDTWLFYTWSGAGMCSSFMYTIHTNTLQVLENSPIHWYITDNVLLGTTLTFAVTERVMLYAYDWDGNILYSKADLVCGSGMSVIDDWVYFGIEVSNADAEHTYNIYKMRIDGAEEQLVCAITTAGCIWFEEDKIICEYKDSNDDWQYHEMSLYNPCDIVLVEESESASSGTPPLEKESGEATELFNSALNYLQSNYPYEKIYDLEFYSESDEIVIGYVKSENNASVYFGIEIGKSDKRVGLYNFDGREIESFYLD